MMKAIPAGITILDLGVGHAGADQGLRDVLIVGLFFLSLLAI
jgi:hypothetical protein